VEALPREASVEFGSVAVRAVRAVHDGRRFPFGPAGETVGYVLTAGARSVYFAGDTALFEGMAHLAAHVDVALLPVWGWGPHLRGGHLTPALAAEATRLIRPTYAVPIHWGTYWPRGLSWYRRGRLTAPAAEFRDHVMAQRLPSTVVVLEPGGRRAFEEL
jgi:L-ascorbate metabolism protein UlaG (beta-lactamase superfamily)